MFLCVFCAICILLALKQDDIMKKMKRGDYMAVSKAQRMATNKYNDNNYDRLAIRIKKGLRDKYKAEAEKRSLSLAEFVQMCVNKEINERR